MGDTNRDTTKDAGARPSGGDAETAAESAGGALETVAGEVQETLAYVADRARDQVASTIESQKERAAEGLGEVAEALRQTTETLRKHEIAAVTPVIATAAERVEQLSEYLQEADLDRLADEVGQFAHRQPTVFLAGAFALGFFGARLLKSRSRRGGAQPTRRRSPKAA
jgi:hypothetical protein